MLSMRQFINNQEQLIDLLMLEALSQKQTEFVKRWSGDNPINRQIHALHDKVFGEGNERITIPLERAPRDHSCNPVHNEIKSHIEQHGYTMGDYDKGEVTDKHGRTTTVGKALGRTKAHPDLMQKFNNDPVRQSAHAHATGKSITISRNPIDVGSMSTGRKWDNVSCMRIGKLGTTTMGPGCNREKIKSDLRHGTLAAYIHHDEDKDLENPLSRVLLKRHDSDVRDESPIFRPESRTYGDQNADINHTLGKWTEKHYPENDDSLYVKHADLYNDDGKPVYEGKTVYKKFNPRVLDHYTKSAGDVNERGQEHSPNHWDDMGEPLQDSISDAIHNYRSKLTPLDKIEMDKHLHMELAHDYHGHVHWSVDDGDSENTARNRNIKQHFHTMRHIPIPKQHIDEIAKKFVDSHAKSHGNHTTADNMHDELEDAVLSHGSDESKADLVNNHRTYGHENPEDSDFDPSRHIIGHKSAKAYHDKFIEENGELYGMPNIPCHRTYENMAKHADDETFHNFLHSPHIKHDRLSYQAMANGASKARQHTMLDNLKFDNGEINGNVEDKLIGLAQKSKSKSVLSRIIKGRGDNKEAAKAASKRYRIAKENNDLEESQK